MDWWQLTGIIIVPAFICFVTVQFKRHYWWWFYGFYQIIVAFRTSHRPSSFGQIVKGEIEAEDGEWYVVWWCPSTGGHDLKSQFDNKNNCASTNPQHVTTNNKVWILLAAGMASGNTFYMWDAIMSGVLGDDIWCLFYNPGIVNQCRKRSPTGLSDTQYLEQFVVRLKKLKMDVSIMGFSAGSLLAIAMANRADEMDDDNRRMKHKRGLVTASESKTLDCCISIHGMDRIRDVFEHFATTYSRLDIPFAYSLYRMMCRSGCTQFLPANAGGGLHKEKFPWLGGWHWMKPYTESVFQTKWSDMEEALWSCSSALSKGPLSTPVFRVMSLNDPIVDFARCCDKSLFKNVDRIYLQPKAGHLCAFKYDKKLGSVIRQWRNDKRGRHHTTSSNSVSEQMADD